MSSSYKKVKMWECNKCGACCCLAGFIIKELDRGDGVCRMLSENNMCSIYETRPEICRVRKDIYPSEQIENACNFLREVHNERTNYVEDNTKSLTR